MKQALSNAHNTWKKALVPSIPIDVSVNFSLGFFFLHFQGLKILPILENLPLRFVGGVASPEFLSSPCVVLCCRPASSSALTWHSGKQQMTQSLTHENHFLIEANIAGNQKLMWKLRFISGKKNSNSSELQSSKMKDQGVLISMYPEEQRNLITIIHNMWHM